MPRYIDADLLDSKYREGTDPQDLYGEIAYLLPEDIDSIPTADVQEVRHGRWMPSLKNIEQEEAAKILGFDLDEFLQKLAYCSVCGIQQTTNGRDRTGNARIHKAIFRYCPNCGAKMDGEADA